MCFKKKVPENPEKRFITFGKNVYPGGNSLNGCVNDSKNGSARVSSQFPEVQKFMFLDNQVTAEAYLKMLDKAVTELPAGGTVCIISDSCFSASATRFVNLSKRQVKSRFFHPGLPEPMRTRSRAFQAPVSEMKWIHMSACGEHQTAADAFFRMYEGAFSHNLWPALKKGITYREWFDEVKKYLPSDVFSQIPTIEGPDYLLDRKVYGGPTVIIHNSSHGSWDYDKNGDEADGKDEGLYFDRLVIDDELNSILMKIK
jgi:hypothetical protein